MASGILLPTALLASIAIGTTAAFLAWRERPQPGALPLVAFLAGQSWWSTCLVFQVQSSTLDGKLFWVSLSWLGVAVIPVTWVLFALEYTGYDEYVRPRNVALLSVIPAITVVLALAPAHHLLYVDSTLVHQNGAVRLVQTPGVWYWVIGAYTYLLGVVGVVPLLGLVTSDATTFRGQSAALLVGSTVPWATNALYLAGVLPTGGLDPTPIAFAVSGVAYLGALTRFRLLGTSPAPNKRARRVVFDRMQEGALVVDNHDYVVDTNESATHILDVHPDDVLGTPAGDVLPEYHRLPDDGTLRGYVTLGDGAYDVAVTPISNRRDVRIGRVVTFHDVSAHLRQQERLKVLNRALRHNIRTETNIIQGYVDRLAGPSEDTAVVREHVHRIEQIGQKGRDAIELFEENRDDPSPTSVADLLEHAVAAVADTHPHVTVDYTPPAESVAVAYHLRTAFENLVENAAEHNTADDPHVAVTADVRDGRVRVRVADNGPGIDEYERAVLQEGDETPLRHGSGLGLWIAKWGVDIADGHITFTDNAPTGTVVTVDLPVLDADVE